MKIDPATPVSPFTADAANAAESGCLDVIEVKCALFSNDFDRFIISFQSSLGIMLYAAMHLEKFHKSNGKIMSHDATLDYIWSLLKPVALDHLKAVGDVKSSRTVQ